MDELFREALQELGNLSGMWNAFAVLDGRGLDGGPVLAPVLGRILAFSAGILLLMVLLRIILGLSRSLSGVGRQESVLGLGIEATLVGALLFAYPDWIRIIPGIFASIGRGVQDYALQDLSAQVSGALAQMGNEKVSEFRLWSQQALALSVAGFLAGIFSTIALVLLWVVAKLQVYLFTFWYLLGPVALPTLLFPPMAHVARIWFSTLLGVSFMGVAGPVFYAILVRSQWLARAFAAGGELDALTCLVFSLLVILGLVSVPVLSMKVWEGIESRVFAGAAGAADGARLTSSALQVTGGRVQAGYQTMRARLQGSAGGSGRASAPGAASASGPGPSGGGT